MNIIIQKNNVLNTLNYIIKNYLDFKKYRFTEGQSNK